MATIKDIEQIIKDAAAAHVSDAERQAWIGQQVENLLSRPASKKGRPATSEQELERLARRAGALSAFGETKKDRARSLVNGVYVRMGYEEFKTASAIEKAVRKYEKLHPEPTADELAEALRPWLDED
jgi:cobalamin-dependent methionine synthase I